MKKLIPVAAMLLATTAHAQQQSTPTEQALGAKLMQEIQGSLTCGANLIAAHADLAKANARIKEMEPKAEAPKKD
jgi:hypothetical protein